MAHPAHARPLTGHDIEQCVDDLFCTGANSNVPRMQRRAGAPPESIVDQFLYRVEVRDLQTGRGHAVSLYTNLGELGASLWEQEVRSMVRIAGMEHSALPAIQFGGIEDYRFANGTQRRVGYIISSRSHTTLEKAGVCERFLANPVWAVRQLAQIADALDLLHRSALLHRNLWARCVEVIADESGELLRLNRFEMSAFHANLLRSALEGDGSSEYPVIRQFINQGRSALAAAPRERLTWLFGVKDREEVPNQKKGDVYSLGVLAFQLLIGSLDETKLESAFPALGGYDGRQFDFNRDGWRELNRWMIERVHTVEHPKLPSPLRRLMASMLAEYPNNRPTADEVFERLLEDYDAISAALTDEKQESRAYAVAVLPYEQRSTIYQWGWITHSPDSDLGFRELQALLEEDLSHGFIEYCASGFTAIERGADDRKERAKYVLCGSRAAYFAEIFRVPYTSREVSQVLLIKYVLSWTDPRAYDFKERRARFRRRIPHLVVCDMNSELIQEDAEAEFPDWSPLLESVAQAVSDPPAQARLKSALRWLLATQETELDARQYAFKRKELRQREEIVLELDLERDERRVLRRPLLRQYASQAERRPPFDAFFGNLDGVDPLVRWRSAGDDSLEGDTRRSGTARVVAVEAPNRIRIRPIDNSTAVPEKGWLSPDDDVPSRISHQRQLKAFDELCRRPELLGVLARPCSFLPPHDRLLKKAAEPIETVAGTKIFEGDSSHRRLSEFLSCWPLYALQGPPGTGKTTVAARAIRATLDAAPASRILVSAQSHYALDHIASSITDILPENHDLIAIRVVSKLKEDKVDPDVQPLLLRNLVRERIGRVEAAYAKWNREDAKDRQDLGKIVEEWKNLAPDSQLELRERLRRGANVVFATCMSATDVALAASGPESSFDWVIIEEAAKAWPTELLLPLLRGSRWTLLGDHQQLPAYRREDIGNFFDECAASSDPELRKYLEVVGDLKPEFDLFARFFKEPVPPSEGLATGYSAVIHHPVGSLDQQFRMEARIGSLVANAFYPRRLFTAESVQRNAPFTHPTAIAGSSLVWLDTTGAPGCFDERQWKNRGEANVVVSLIERLRPKLALLAQERLAILTPYRAQVSLLKEVLALHHGQLCDSVHTVDSFQGRESECVIVSLVRQSQVERTSVKSRLGHLDSDQRVNVLLSRARALLIVVGSLSYFRSAGELAKPGDPGSFWKTICDFVETEGLVVSAASLPPAVS